MTAELFVSTTRYETLGATQREFVVCPTEASTSATIAWVMPDGDGWASCEEETLVAERDFDLMVEPATLWAMPDGDGWAPCWEVTPFIETDLTLMVQPAVQWATPDGDGWAACVEETPADESASLACQASELWMVPDGDGWATVSAW